MGSSAFTCYRVALTLLNVFYLIVSFILIALAAYGKVVASIETFSIMGGIIACGIFLFLIAIIGLIGTVQHHQVLLFFYMMILFLLFIVQFALACACLALTSSQQKRLLQTSWDLSSSEQKIEMQKMFNCCGFDENPTRNSTSSTMPSCKELDLKCCTNTSQPASCASCKSCWIAVSKSVDEMVKLVGGLSLFFSFTEILGVWLTMRYRNQKDPYANPNAFL